MTLLAEFVGDPFRLIFPFVGLLDPGTDEEPADEYYPSGGLAVGDHPGADDEAGRPYEIHHEVTVAAGGVL